MINTTVSDWRKYFRVVFFSLLFVVVLNSSSLLLLRLRLFLGWIIRLLLNNFCVHSHISMSAVATHELRTRNSRASPSIWHLKSLTLKLVTSTEG